MKHEDFPVTGFEFMNEPATEVQKRIIVELAKQAGYNIASEPWPNPFSKWDAKCMIDILEEELGEKT